MSATVLSKALDKFAEHGFAGMIVVVLLVALWWLHRTNRQDAASRHETHVAERKEWRESIERQGDALLQTTNRNTDVLSELTTILKTRNRPND